MAWNVNYAAFALYARNLYQFLTNEKDPRSFKASDYATFAANGKSLEGIMFNLHEQVFHPGKARVGAQKVGIDKANKVFAWIQENMDRFLGQLAEPYKSAWNPDMADLSKVSSEVLRLSQPTTTTHATMMSVTVVERAKQK
jgi:hypothetical protein